MTTLERMPRIGAMQRALLDQMALIGPICRPHWEDSRRLRALADHGLVKLIYDGVNIETAEIVELTEADELIS